MLSVELKAYGEGPQNLTVVDIPSPGKAGPGEALVSMLYAPVNPSDLLVMQGVFPVHPDLPSPIGNEGVGRVLAVGKGVDNVKAGDLVLPPLYSLTWREQLLVPAARLFALPTEADPLQLAMLSINPVTASLLLSEYVDLKPGDWIIQNCGTSGVARSVIAIAKSRGLKTINLVRRQESIPDVQAAGGDLVLVDADTALEEIKRVVGKGGIKIALDGVGGANARRLASALSSKAVLVAYAVMGGDLTSSIGVLDLIFKDVSFKGFFQDRREYDAVLPNILREMAALVASGKLNVPVAAVYPIEEAASAVEHVRRGGKVLLKIDRDA